MCILSFKSGSWQAIEYWWMNSILGFLYVGYIFILNMVIVSDRFLWQVGLFDFSIIDIKKLGWSLWSIIQLININSVFLCVTLFCILFHWSWLNFELNLGKRRRPNGGIYEKKERKGKRKFHTQKKHLYSLKLTEMVSQHKLTIEYV